MPTVRGQRVEDNCKTIQGSNAEYNLDFETDNYENYVCIVKRDHETSYGPPLETTSLCPWMEADTAEMDRMLSLTGNMVKRGTPMTKGED